MYGGGGGSGSGGGMYGGGGGGGYAGEWGSARPLTETVLDHPHVDQETGAWTGPGRDPRRGGLLGGGGGAGHVDHIKKIIMDSNPLMEAFGNAKTVRNDNSSRFGKYLEIQFDDNSAPVGGVVSTFLLEATRVAYQQKKERNFHIFYQVARGLDQATKAEFGIDCDTSNFWYLAQSGCTTADGVDDAVEFREVREAMRTVGITDGEAREIFRVLAAILHIGNIRFEGDSPANVIDKQPLEAAAAVLQVEPMVLHQSLNHRQIQSGSARGTQYAVPQNADQSASIRDALAKTLYARVFDFIVARINQSMAASGNYNVIGVLDIYGFEIFERNSFEQFCINYVNERLQQIFIDLTVRGEQKEYHDEGMKWKDIKFFDNKIVCDLIHGRRPPGIMRLLDDTCRSVHSLGSEAADAKFMEKLIGTLASHQHLVVGQTGSAARQFTIKHYAGDVEYTIDEFCFKNNDNLYVSLVQVGWMRWRKGHMLLLGSQSVSRRSTVVTVALSISGLFSRTLIHSLLLFFLSFFSYRLCKPVTSRSSVSCSRRISVITSKLLPQLAPR
jgi:myosin I